MRLVRCGYTEASQGGAAPWTLWSGHDGHEIRACFDYVQIKGDAHATATLGVPMATEISMSPSQVPHACFPSDHIPMVSIIVPCG